MTRPNVAPFPSASPGASGTATTKLRFNQKLVIAPGKPVATNALLSALKDLHSELSHMDQEHVDTRSLVFVTQQLVSASLIGHRDKGVKIYTACCIADLLRLYAPDAPYNEDELRTVFEFFVRQLRNINELQNPYHQYYYYLLESLSQVKSILLVADIPNGEDILNEIFKDFFDLVSTEVTKAVRGFMTDILIQLTDEHPSFPDEAFELIMAQFLPRRKEANPAAYQMAVDVCKAATERLLRYVSQYFTDVIMTANKPSGGSLSEEDLKEFQKVHYLIKELNAAAPGLLLNVIPQLEEELLCEDTNIRIMATSLLGEMFAEKASQLATNYPNVFRTWIGRRNDKQPVVRVSWVEHALPVLMSHPQFAREINESLLSKVIDPEDRVRAVVCKAVGALDFETVLHQIDQKLLEQIGGRCRDKKHLPRQEAFKSLARLYSLAYPEILDGDELVASKFGWIPSSLLDAAYTREPDIILAMEVAMNDFIFPADPDDGARADRLLTILSGLTERAMSAFRLYLQMMASCMKLVNNFLDACKKYNGGIVVDENENQEEVTEQLKQAAKRVADEFVDSSKVYGHLIKFAQMHDSRCYKDLRECMNPEAEYNTILKAESEVLKRIANSAVSVAETFGHIIRRISFKIVNKSIIPFLIHEEAALKLDICNQKGRGKANSTHSLLKDISLVFPLLFRAHLPELNQMLQDSVDEGLVADVLEVYAKYARALKGNLPDDNTPQQRLMELALHPSMSIAKNSVVILSHRHDGPQACADLVEKLVSDLVSTSPVILSRLSALAQLVLYHPRAFETHSEQIVQFIVRDLVIAESRAGDDDDVQWVEYENLDISVKAKILGLKVLVNRLTAFAKDANAKKLAQPVFRILFQALKLDGELLPNRRTAAAHRSHLRSACSVFLLRLIRSPAYEAMISEENFRVISMVLQDAIYNVRVRFVTKLVRYLRGLRIHSRYLASLPLVAHDPEDDIKGHVKGFLSKHSRWKEWVKQNHTLFEDILPRLVHLLAHHPDFGREVEDIRIFAVYIKFYLDAIARPDNISLLYNLASKLRTIRDVEEPDRSANIYVLSDLAMLLIKERAAASNWTLSPYEGDVRLPPELFKKLPSGAVAEKIMKKSYLPAEYNDSHSQITKRENNSDHAKKRESAAHPARHQESSTEPAKTPIRKRTRSSDLPKGTRTSTPKRRDS